MPKKPKIVWVGSTPITLISAKERRKINKSLKKRSERLRRRYPEVHGKVVDFISHSIEDGTLYISVRFKVPAQPVEATPSSALIRQCLHGRSICLAALGQNLARAAFRLV